MAMVVSSFTLVCSNDTRCPCGSTHDVFLLCGFFRFIGWCLGFHYSFGSLYFRYINEDIQNSDEVRVSIPENSSSDGIIQLPIPDANKQLTLDAL